LIKKGADVNAKNKLDKSIMDVAKYEEETCLETNQPVH